MPLPASPPFTASYSTASTSLSSDGKRHMRRKDFQYKYGKKHHSYDNEKAPYPLSYDKHVLELYVQTSSPLGAQYQCLSCLLLSIYSESLDNRLAQYLRGSISFAN